MQCARFCAKDNRIHEQGNTLLRYVEFIIMRISVVASPSHEACMECRCLHLYLGMLADALSRPAFCCLHLEAIPWLDAALRSMS